MDIPICQFSLGRILIHRKNVEMVVLFYLQSSLLRYLITFKVLNLCLFVFFVFL